jgi:hypothetical protein
VRGGHERARLTRSSENDVARLVADEERANDVRSFGEARVHDAHTVGKMVDDPDLAVDSFRDSQRLEAHGDRRGMHEAVILYSVDLQSVVRSVRRVQERSVR